nr:MAG TPA: hypothetical protein [Microviridae sp.]
MDKDKIFLQSHAKAIGMAAAKVMLQELKAVKHESPSKVYIDAYGCEVHVNGPTVAPLSKPETLAQKIARFDALAEKVRASRALMMGLVQDFNEEDGDLEDGSFADETPEVDDFGDVLESVPVQKQSTGDGDGEQSPAVKSNGDEKPTPEPVDESVDGPVA